ncbi:hypothetical protein GCM10009862_05460 [Microbacterium binotii]|uniref:Uncharacterized protein n=1 Tax=Microbacterium binotii TaxID=462710 RepID=A0ABN3P874_9MICO
MTAVAVRRREVRMALAFGRAQTAVLSEEAEGEVFAVVTGRQAIGPHVPV